jgi:O-antigen/teichoic acid export membrane protein
MIAEDASATSCGPAPSRGAVAIHGGAIRIVGYLSGILISLGGAALLVRHLGIATFGQYVTVLSVVALVGGVTEAGIAVYGIREYTSDTRGRALLIANLLGLRASLALLGIACGAIFGLIVGYSNTLVLGILIAGVGLLLQVISDVLSVPLQSELRLGQLALVEMARRVTGLALIAALVITGARLLPFFAVTIVGGAVAVAVLLRLDRAQLTARVRFNARGWSGILRDSLPFAIAASIGALYFYVTIVLMSLIASALQTGYFATSFRVTQVALAVPVLALTAVFPLIARSGQQDLGEFSQIMTKVLDSAIIFGPWMSIALGLGADFIVNVIAGHRGHGAIAPLRIQGLVLTASFISTSCMLGLLALHRYRPMILATSCALMLNLALGLALIPALGARGGAIADVVTEAFVSVGAMFAFLRCAPRSVHSSVIPAVSLATGLGVAVALLPVASVVRVIVATLIYFATLLAAGAIPDELTDAVRAPRGLGPPRVVKADDG